jgi:hypothetical protein
MLAEAIAIDIVCASTISDTCKLPTSSLFRFSYNFSAKPKSGLKRLMENYSIFERRKMLSTLVASLYLGLYD